MNSVERICEDAIEDMQLVLRKIHNESFEKNSDVQKLVADVEAHENFDYLKKNINDGVSYCYALASYFNLEDFTVHKRISLLEYLRNLCIEVNEKTEVAYCNTAEEIFFNWRERLVNYTPTSSIFYYHDELEGLIFAQLESEKNGIFGDYFKVDSEDQSIEEADLRCDYSRFWSPIKGMESDDLIVVLQKAMDLFVLARGNDFKTTECLGLGLSQKNIDQFSERGILVEFNSDTRFIHFEITVETSELIDGKDYEQSNLYTEGFRENGHNILTLRKTIDLTSFASSFMGDRRSVYQ